MDKSKNKKFTSIAPAILKTPPPNSQTVEEYRQTILNELQKLREETIETRKAVFNIQEVLQELLFKGESEYGSEVDLTNDSDEEED